MTEPASGARNGEGARAFAALYGVALVLVSAHFALAYLIGTNSYVNLHDYVSGTAPLPFQYRALTAWILSGVARLGLLQGIAARLPAPFSQPEALALLLLVWMSMAALIEISRRAILALVSDRPFAAVAAFLTPAAAYVSYVAIANSYRFSYPYDIPALALFSLGYYFILTENFAALCVAFLFATLSRETSLFLIAAYLCQRWEGSGPTLRREGFRVLILAAIFVAAKFYIFSLYGGNLRETGVGHHAEAAGAIPGALFVFQLGQNLENLVTPAYWPSLLSAVGWLWLPVLFGWKLIGRAEIRRTLLVLAPLWFAAMMIVGRITEVRVFGELILPFACATAFIAKNALGRRAP